MFKSKLQLLLVLLLLFAIPLRGFAASNMVACNPNSSSRIQTNNPMHDNHPAHDHEKAGDLHHLDKHLDKHLGHASNDAESDSAPHQSTTDCTQCAPCCLTGALNSHTTEALFPPLSSIDFPTLTEIHHSALVLSLDHPPK
jgi:uncharacterized protein involved in copper resistance